MRVARRALASRGRAAWMLPQAERGWSLEGRLWRLGMPPLGLVVVLRVYPHEEAARRRREAMLPVLQSGQHPHEVLDTQLTPWCGKAGRELRWAGSLRFLANGWYRGGVGEVYCV